MDRNREARRATNMAAPPNGLSSSRRRHRSSSLRDSTDEDGAVELQESGRLRDRGVVKKDRGDRDRDRERERERSSRSKRRRENRMMIHHVTTGINRDDGDDTSEESVNDEDEEDDDDAGNGGGLRMLPPPPANPTTATAAMTSNHHNHNPHPQQLHHRKSFPPSANKVFRAAAAPPPAWKAADEMIGVSVPRKARSASTKRSHEWISGGAVVGGGGGTEQVHRQSSTSPVRLASSVASPALVAPPSPSSSNVSVRKKMKANGGGSKPRPPKSSSKSSSSNPEELEIEIAEVLYGLMTQSQAPSKKEIPSNDSTTKFDSNKSSSDTKSRVSSPISNSTAPPQNSTSLSTVAPKRKRPRQVSENPFSVRSSPVSSSIKNEIDHHQHHQSPKTDISSPYLENNSPGSAAAAAENGVSFGFTSVPAPSSEPPLPLPQPPVEEEGKCGVGVVLTKEEVEKESPAVGINNGNGNTEAMITTAASTTATNLNTANLETESQKEEKFEIDLMAPPPQLRTSPGRDGDIGFSDHKQMAKQETSKNLKDKEDEKLKKSGKEESMDLTDEQKQPKAGTLHETGESSKQVMNEERNIELHIDLEKPNKDSASMVSGGSNRSLHQALKHQQLSAKPARDETHTEKTAQPSSMPTLPMSLANWPPMGYVAPLQGVIPMDGNKAPSAPIQPIFTHPRPKRCATHCYIARNIHYLQQFMKLNPFWPAASGSAPIFGAKHCNLNVLPELHGSIPMQAIPDKGQGVGIFPGHTAAGKDNKSSQSAAIPDPSAQRKQQVLLQQPLPPVTPNNILHGPAFIFPFNQQQASASVRPGSSKLTSSTAGASGAPANSATMSGASTTPAAPALSFNYPNMTANETQYLAILQNNPYTFPIPAVGTPPNYRGNPHAQAMPLFNGSFYSSQMIHPSQIPQPPQQAPPPTQAQNHHPSHSQTHQNSSGSTSSSQKHLQTQQRQQGSGAAVNGGGSGGSLHNSYPGHKSSRSQAPSQQQQQHMNPPPHTRHLENEVAGGEDSPSTADSRVSRAATTMSVYGHNFAMPVHSQNFAMMNPQSALSIAAASGNNSNDKKQQQHQQQQSQQQQQGLKRGGVDSTLPPQTFAMSFAPMNGTTGTMSSMAQNHAIFQNLPESVRQSYHHMMTGPPVTASAHHSQQKKDFRISEEASRTVGHDSSNGDDERKGGSTGLAGKSGSIAFSRPDLAVDASGSSPISGTSVIDSSSRNINLGSNNRSSRSPMSTSVAAAQSSHHLHAQFHHQQQQQQVLQLQKQQQQNASLNARNKNQPSSNGSVYPDHLITSSSMAAKFPNSISSFPQNLVQTSNTSSSPAQSPQWRNSVRGPTTSQVPSSLAASANTSSSLKNLHQTQQQQSSRSHTQISFGAATQKLPSTTSSSQMQQQNPSNSSNQCPSPPMLVGSPTTSSISKGNTTTTTGATGAGGSPRTNASASTSGRTGQPPASLSSSQQPKNSPVGTQRSSPSPSILGNPHITNSNSTKSQQQLPKQTLQQQQAQQAHLFFTHPYMPVQQQQQQQQPQAQQHSGGGSTAATGTSGYYLPRKQQQQQNPQSSSTGMLSLASGTTSDPAKAIAAATSNLKGGGASQQGIIHAYAAAQTSNAGHQLLPAGFPQYAPTPVQVKPAEQKQPAGGY
ncbi:protein TIME FOR COFFEE isoform X2 [Cynara cardunculus var. scolymus]|uniref:protein TIME FOR COFFEE isoform X2 n=1 Tax=Cynara cardunculus var. scolymus TaxID=59895 RepID=UPI000D625DAD|nr:protein TIME FOR COFFEE isoform X2 [Cynara cardunculus var. scolymus]